MSHIQSTLSDGVLSILMTRVDKKNALTLEMYRQLGELLHSAEQDSQVRVVTISGGPECFCAGNDLRDFLSSGELNAEHPVVNFLQVIRSFKKPIIAGVAGFAVGIGTTLLLHCDLIYAAPTAQFQLPFAALGLCPEGGSSILLPNIVGYHKAAEMLLFGEQFDAHKAHQWGIVNAVIDGQPIDDYILARAQALAKLPFESVCETKRLLKSQQQQVAQVMDAEIAAFERLLHSDTCQRIIKQLVG